MRFALELCGRICICFMNKNDHAEMFETIAASQECRHLHHCVGSHGHRCWGQLLRWCFVSVSVTSTDRSPEKGTLAWWARLVHVGLLLELVQSWIWMDRNLVRGNVSSKVWTSADSQTGSDRSMEATDMSDPVQYHEAKGLLLSSSTPGAEPLNQQDRRVGRQLQCHEMSNSWRHSFGRSLSLIIGFRFSP